MDMLEKIITGLGNRWIVWGVEKSVSSLLIKEIMQGGNWWNCSFYLQVLFIHKYSGGMMLDSVIIISSSYLFAAAGVIYIQSLTQGFPEPPIDLKYIGFLIFLIGISGNFYHHYLLSRMRGKNEKGYKIPQGGLFGLVICPHYLFEIIAFVGISFISQTLFTYCCTVGIAVYLMSRSFVTRKWYLSKFENFPKNVKALIPYVFWFAVDTSYLKLKL